MRAVATAALFALAWPAGADAATLGGGTAPTGLSGYRDQLTIVSLRSVAGTAIVRALVQTRCGPGTVKRTVELGPDGSFALNATVRDRPPEDRRIRRVAVVRVSGRLQGTVAAGMASARIRLVRDGATVARCTSGRRAWQARVAAPEPTVAPARPNSVYYGLTGQPGRPRALVLRVGAHRIAVAAFEYRLRCEKRGSERANITPGGSISAGTFNLRERFTLRFAGATERFRVKVDGRFTTAGVNGSLSVVSVARSPSGAVIDRCRTGRVPFAGAL